MSDIVYHVKTGVDMSGLAPEIARVLEPVGQVFASYGLRGVVTSARRAPAGRFSYHHVGKAVDFRGKHVQQSLRQPILDDIRRILGADYDVIAHGEGDNFHYHIEFDPKQE